MRIAQIHNEYLHPGGEETIADTETALLREAGHEVDQVRIRNPRGRVRSATSLALAPWNPIQAGEIIGRLGPARPDVAHIHNTWYAFSPSILTALRRAGIPTVMTIQNFRLVCAQATLFRDGRPCTDCVGTHPWRAVVHRCYRSSAAASAIAAATIELNRRLGTWDAIDRFFVPSLYVRGVLLEAGFDADHMVVKPNVVPDPGPRALPPSASSTLLYVGRLSKEKGPDILIEAWRRSEAHLRRDLELVIIGDGPMATELGATGVPRVRFLGRVDPDRVYQEMLRARALVFPTQCNENFGRSIVEAMASGLPVLASDLATPGELVRQVDERWVVTPADLRAWAAGLGMLGDDEMVDAAGRQARALYEAAFTPATGVRQLVDVYEDVQRVHRGGLRNHA